jgi:hypothetical protein
MEKARKIYNEMILAKCDLGKYVSSIWVEFYDLEKQFGDEKHQRKLLNRAVNELADGDEKDIVYDLLVKFEKLNGNVHQFSQAYTKYESFKKAREIEMSQRNQRKKGGGADVTKHGSANDKTANNKNAKKQKPTESSENKTKSMRSNETNNLKRKVIVRGLFRYI